MTVEAFVPSPVYVIAGPGPYGVTHAYRQGALRVAVWKDGIRTELSSSDFTASPADAEEGGTVTLSAAAATTHAGGSLFITRETSPEQGWEGTTSRERGLEAQLDWITQAVQDLASVSERSLRLPLGDPSQPELPPLVGRRSKWLGFDADGKLFAGTPADTDAVLVSAFGELIIAAADRVAARSILGFGQLPRTASAAASLAAEAAGTVGQLAGLAYVVDPSATGADSATGDLGVNGLVPHGTASLAHFGATGDGVTDDTAAIQRALTWCSARRRRLYVPSGTYRMTEAGLTGSYHVDMFGDVANRPRFIATEAAAAAGARLFEFVGTAQVTGLALASSVKPNQRTITLTDASAVQVGMVIRLTSSILWPYDNRGVQFKGEIHEVIGKTGNTLTIRDSTRDSYAPVNMQAVEAWIPNQLALENIVFEVPDGTSTGCVFFTRAMQPRIRNCHALGGSFFQFMNIFCIGTHYTDVEVGPCYASGAENGYGISDRSSLGTKVRNFTSNGLRASYDSHSSSGASSCPTRDAMIDGFVVRGGGAFYPDTATECRGIGQHGPTEGLRIMNGFITDVLAGIRVRGKNTLIQNVAFSGLVPDAILATDGTGLVVTDCFADAFNLPLKGISPGEEVAGSGIGDFVQFGIASASTSDWQWLHPTVIQDNTVVGGRQAFLNFARPGDARNLDIRNNSIQAQAGAGNTYHLLAGTINVARSAIVGNRVETRSGAYVLAQDTVQLGWAATFDIYPAVQTDNGTWVVRIADDSHARILLNLPPLFHDRPIMAIGADAGGTAIFQMRRVDPTLTLFSGTFSALAASATPTALTGTGGVDGNVTLGLTSSGELFLENRSGGPRTFRLSVLA